MSLLQLKHICKSFSGVYANENINLSVEKGEIHALLGKQRRAGQAGRAGADDSDLDAVGLSLFRHFIYFIGGSEQGAPMLYRLSGNSVC